MCVYLCCFSAAQGSDLRSSPAFSWQWGEGWLAMRLAVQPNQWLSEGGGQSGRQHLCAKHAGLGIADYIHCRFIATCVSWSTIDLHSCAFINKRVINYKFQKSILFCPFSPAHLFILQSYLSFTKYFGSPEFVVSSFLMAVKTPSQPTWVMRYGIAYAVHL